MASVVNEALPLDEPTNKRAALISNRLDFERHNSTTGVGVAMSCSTLRQDPATSGVMGQKVTGGGAQSRLMFLDGKGVWTKGPLPRALAEKLVRTSQLLQHLPGRFTLGRLAEYGGRFYVVFDTLTYVREGLDAVPVETVEWVSKSGEEKSQRVLNWRAGVNGLGAEFYFTNNYKNLSRVKELPPALLVAYLEILLSRAIALVGDSAPRNTWYDLTAMPPDYEGRPWAYIESLTDKGASRLVSGDFDKDCDLFDTVRKLWEVAVVKKHGKDVQSALLDTLLRAAPELLAEYAAVDGSVLPSDAQARLGVVMELLRAPEVLCGGAAPPPAMVAASIPPDTQPAAASAPSGGAGNPIVLMSDDEDDDDAVGAPEAPPLVPEGAVPGFITLDFEPGRATNMRVGRMSPEVVAALNALLREAVPGLAISDNRFTTAHLASLIQKSNRSSNPRIVKAGMALAMALYRFLGRAAAEDARLTGVTKYWQSLQTFIRGRMLVALFEDAAASPAAIGSLIGLAESFLETWPAKPKPSAGAAAKVAWLERRDELILDGLGRMAAVALTTPDRARPCSLGSCRTGPKQPWPKEGKPVQGPVMDLPPGLPLVWDPALSYTQNTAAALRVAEQHIRRLGGTDEAHALNRLLAVVWAFTGSVDRATLDPHTKRIMELNACNEPQVFLWYLLMVLGDPALMPRSGDVVLPEPPVSLPEPALTPELVRLLADQHCGGACKAIGFTPGATMGVLESGVSADIHSRPSAPGDSEARKWFAARASPYFAGRRDANEEAAALKRRAIAGGPATKKRRL